MDTTAPAQRRSNVPYGFLGMIVLVVAIEATVARYHSIEGHGIGYEWWLTGQRAAQASRKYDVLCFGDSQVKLDVQPKVLEPILGRKVFDLGVVGGQATTSYFLFRRALDAGARPKAVLVDFFHPLLMGMPVWNWEYLPLILTGRDAVELSWNSAEPDVLADWFLRRAIPTYGYRSAIRHALGIDKAAVDPYEQGAGLARNTARNLGAMAADENPAWDDDPRKYGRFVAPIAFGCSHVNRVYLDKFLALAEAHHVRVFYILCPCSPNWQRASTARDPEGNYHRAIRRHVLTHPNVQVVDARFAGYELGLFLDHSHLSHRGALLFSTDLAHAVKRELGPDATGERWLEVRRLETPPPAISLETINQSEHAVRERVRR